jgi:hypothetical protein
MLRNVSSEDSLISDQEVPFSAIGIWRSQGSNMSKFSAEPVLRLRSYMRVMCYGMTAFWG